MTLQPLSRCVNADQKILMTDVVLCSSHGVFTGRLRRETHTVLIRASIAQIYVMVTRPCR